MTRKILFLRGNTAQSTAYTGLVGEITIDTTANSIRVHDNTTAGGHLLLSQTAVDAQNSNISILQANVVTLTANAAVQAGNIATLSSNVATHTANIATLFANAATQAASLATLTANAATQAASLATLTANAAIQADTMTTLFANAGAQSSVLSSLDTALQSLSATVATDHIAVVAMSSTVGNTSANVHTLQTTMQTMVDSSFAQDTDITALKAAAVAQAANTTSRFSDTITANTAMKAYVDAQDVAGAASWVANAATQAGQITSLTNSIAGANAAIVTANTAMKSYVDAINTALVANDAVQTAQITGANTAIVTANTALKAYSDATFATLVNPVFPGNLTVTGNLFVNGNTTTINANTFTVNDNIIYMANANPANSLDIGVAGHFNNGTYQHTGLVRQASTGQWKLFSNVIPEPGNTLDFTNAVYDAIQVGAITSPTITDLYSNAAVQAASIATLTANAGAQSDAIALKAPIASPSFTGNIGVAGNIVFQDGTYQSSAASGSGLTSRTSIVATPTVLTSNIGGNINITGYKGYALYSIATTANTTANVWVTVYSNIAARTADYSRSVTTDPAPGTGIIAEVINVGNVTQYFTPAIYGFNNEATANTNVPLKVTVTSATTANVTVTVTMLKLEN